MDGDKDDKGEDMESYPTMLSCRVSFESKEMDLVDLVVTFGQLSVDQENAEFWEAVERDNSLKEWRKLGDRYEKVEVCM